MRHDETPVLDPRDAAQVFGELLQRRPAYVPEWVPAQDGVAQALLQIFSRYMQVIIDRLNQAPDKNLLAFLDLLGMSLIPARAARAPVVFQPLPNATDGRIAGGTRLGAQVPGRPDPVMFETENSIAMAAAHLVEVVTLWPARDEYADHSTAFAGGRPFTLFDPRRPVLHELYLAHDTLFAFAGKATVEIEFELATPGSVPLSIVWEHWNGQVWRPFKDFDSTDATASQDGTDGLTRSGVVMLRTECDQAEKTTIHGINAYWVRGRLNQPLPPDPARVLPEVDRIRVRSIIERPVQTWEVNQQHISGDLAIQGVVKHRDGTPLTGIQVVLVPIVPGVSIFIPPIETDARGRYRFEATANTRYKLGLIASHLPSAEQELHIGTSGVRVDFVVTPGVQPNQAFADGSALELSTTFFPFGRSPDRDTAFYFASEEVFSKPGARVTVSFRRGVTPEEEADRLGTEYEVEVKRAQELLRQAGHDAARSVLEAARTVTALARLPSQTLENGMTILDNMINNPPSDIRLLANAAREVVNSANEVAVGLITPPFFLPNLGISQNEAQAGHDATKRAAEAAASVLSNSLSRLTAVEAAAAGDEGAPDLSPPRLGWEYWNGHRWQNLIGPIDDHPANFLASGEVPFDVPFDLEPTIVNGITARWLRVRVMSGSYNRLRLVSWVDAQSGHINFFPIIEPRPPVLENFSLGYTYRSPWTFPEHCLTYNDFRFELRGRDVRVPGRFFPPLRPVADTTPAVYLGFDRPLPNDLISLYLDLQESETTTPPLVWEAWDGTTWRDLSVTDETAGLGRSGMVSFIAPAVAPRPEVAIRQASGTQITVSGALMAAVFEPGDQVSIRSNETGETALVQQVEGEVIHLETPLADTYTGGTVSLAALPRFGTPRDWVRARLKEDGAPARSRMDGIHLNAAWAVQLQTVHDEVLGSGTGQINQTFFFSQVPVLPGEQIEVRELEGARADVELPILREALFKRGLTEDDIRLVFDPRTGRATEVWVRWQPRPHLYFSGPEDRHYVVERARGRLIFGDGRHGQIPTVSPNNIRARLYRAGGGPGGNVPAGTITQLLSAAPFVQAVTNPRAADGGAEGETPEAVKTRGPQTLRHRGRALAARDYETLAREASPGVAAVRALPATAPNGRPAPGWVTLILVPQSQDPQPQPSLELRRQVHAYLTARVPATVAAGRIAVIGPTYLPIGVAARVTPRDVSAAGTVERRVRAALTSFLHPLTGGPQGRGWPFGRNVYLSDVAVVVEAVDGVDYAEELNLLLNDTPQGESVAVSPDRIVVAGPIRIEMKAPER